MSINFSKARAELWKNEILNLLDLFQDFLDEFNLNLYSCNMERISFFNGKFFFHVTYAYDRFQMEQNTEMPLTMLVFGNGSIEKNLIEIFNEKINNIDVYSELRILNQETNNQGLTYNILLKKYIVPLINRNQLF